MPHSPWTPWMRRALQLAALAEGCTSPNPLVGAVVLDAAGVLAGEGFHARAGEPHAEVGALRQAGERARGGTLVVTLEPCCHHGRTPPCSEAVIAAGLARVVVAMGDPNPRVAGGGLAQLRAAGLEVIAGVLEREARALNAPFLHRLSTGRPLGILKWAMSLDGRTALPNGASQWISAPPARGWVHGLRSRCDAVIVGGGTVRADDPLLTSRGRRSREPLRVVLSRTLDLPETAQLWDTRLAPTLVAHGPEAPAEARAAIDRRVADGLRAEAIEAGDRPPTAAGAPADDRATGRPAVARLSSLERLELPACDPSALLEALAGRGCNRVLWECGPELAATALRQGCVQRIAAVIAPKLLGGHAARTALGDLGLEAMDEVSPWQELSLERLGPDLLWQLHGPGPV
ncbi:MAG: bifunctional diaminohydroxyphosphoribosylaminopyrimidine deaminase/5-amino-6-(5-phosphoribosylamino)uracil reductase RibD [Cyanobium sp.]